MVEKEVVVVPEEGIHARPASLLVKAAKSHTSDVVLVKGGVEANAKSPLKIMTLAARRGDTVTVRADGPDEEAALDALVRIVAGEEG